MMLSYLLKTILISGILTGYYLLFLKNRGFHRFNRLFLLSVPAVSFLLPVFRFESPAFWQAKQAGTPIRLLQVVQGELEETVTVYANRSVASWFTWQNGLAALSICVSGYLLVRLLLNLNYLRRLARQAVVERIEGADLCYVQAKGTPFSFFKRIFWNPALDVQSAGGRQILRHELFHVNQHHSHDILWLESIGILAWFNPFLYIIRREVIMVHEFMADAEVGALDPMEYAGLLLRYQAGRFSYSGITHSFFHHPLKRRIIMLTKIPFQKNKITGRLLLLPVLAALAALFAFKNDWRPELIGHPVKKIRIVLDPGHSATNQGASFNGVKEEDFNLMLAKKIRDAGKSYDVDIVLTREGDNTPAEQTLRSSLEYRTKFAAEQHADAFISIHMNSNESGSVKESGFEIYISKKADKESEQYKQSVKLGSSLNAALAKDYKTGADLIQRDKGVYILDEAKVPAVLLECGSMDVKEDMEFMSQPENQDKIARDIIEGVLKFTSASTGYVEPPSISHGPNASNENHSADHIIRQETNLVVENAEDWSIDTITRAQLYKIDPNTIERMDVTKKKDERKIVVTLKNGERHVVIMNNELLLNDSTPALKKVEVESEYPGGQSGWRNYLIKNLHYPAAAVSHEIQGMVMVEFIVKADGSIDPKDIKVKTGPKELREESVRVIRDSGRWIPAQDHGVAVNAYKMQPINYKLEVPAKK